VLPYQPTILVHQSVLTGDDFKPANSKSVPGDSPIFDGVHMVAGIKQYSGVELAHGRLVIHHQNAMGWAAPGIEFLRPPGRLFAAFRQLSWQHNRLESHGALWGIYPIAGLLLPSQKLLIKLRRAWQTQASSS
jgi:hypothetical protein